MLFGWGKEELGKGVHMRWIIVSFAMLGLAACSGGVSEGPDEFSVVPSSELEQPISYNDLPIPTPGASNRADVNPNADAIAVLGGRVQSGRIPASDGAIVRHTSRFGVDPSIRPELFTVDKRLHKNRGRFTLLRGRASYLETYRRQTLDPYRELERFRAAGVKVPTAPPAR